MEKIKLFIQGNKFNLGIIIIWFLIVFITMLNHEIWRDEAQVWCVVRDLGFFDILGDAKAEGHPFFWYLLLMPPAKFGLPVISMQILSLIFVFSAVIFFVFKAPFNKFLKIIIIFSSGLLYFLPVIARNYSLIPLFIFLLADLYPKRKEKPYLYMLLLILLSNTHLLMLGFCVILSFLFSFEKLKEYFKIKKTNPVSYSAAGSSPPFEYSLFKVATLKFSLTPLAYRENLFGHIKVLYPVIILMFNFLILFLLFCNTSNENFVIKEYIETNGKLSIIEIFRQFCDVYFLILPFVIRCIIFYLSIGLILFYLYWLNKKSFLIFAGSFAYFLWIFAKVWFGGIPYQKAYLLLLILIFCVWIAKCELYMISKQTDNTFTYHEILLKRLNYIVILLFFISTVFSFAVITGDIKYNFSGGKQIAQFIRKNLNGENTFIVLGYPYTFSPICAYLPDKKFYYYNKNYYITYFDFKDLRNNNDEEFPQNVKYYIVQDNFYLHEDLGFKKIFASDKENISSKLKKEIFTIYEKEADFRTDEIR